MVDLAEQNVARSNNVEVAELRRRRARGRGEAVSSSKA
jgi:hypothetical protein